MKIFLSHSSKDEALVKTISDYFPKHLGRWLAEYELLIGEEFELSIKKNIKESDYLVIFLSKEAVQSEWVKRELTWALERENKLNRVFVLPILFDDVWEKVKPKKFQKRQYLKCFDKNSDNLQKVAQQLNNDISAWLSRRLAELEGKSLETRMLVIGQACWDEIVWPSGEISRPRIGGGIYYATKAIQYIAEIMHRRVSIDVWALVGSDFRKPIETMFSSNVINRYFVNQEKTLRFSNLSSSKIRTCLFSRTYVNSLK